MRRPIAIALLVLCSCQKVVTLNLNNAAPQLVIEGNVTDGPSPDTVTIFRSVNFYADNNFPAVEGASVTISDNTGVKDLLTEISPGIYITHSIQGTPGNTYSLSVVVNDTAYTATSAMPQPVNLDSITFLTSSLIRKDQITPVANFQDPPGLGNYYRFAAHINGGLFTKDIFVFEDRLSDGRYINDNLRMDSSYLNPGDLLQVDMYCVDKNDYTYFFQLERSSSTGTFNTEASPANPSTNITNGAYGYFSAHTVRSKTVSVP